MSLFFFLNVSSLSQVRAAVCVCVRRCFYFFVKCVCKEFFVCTVEQVFFFFSSMHVFIIH